MDKNILGRSYTKFDWVSIKESMTNEEVSPADTLPLLLAVSLFITKFLPFDQSITLPVLDIFFPLHFFV